VLEAEPHAANVDSDDAIENLNRIFRNRLEVTFDARVGEENVDSAIAFDRRLQIPLRVVIAGNVRAYPARMFLPDRVDGVAQCALFDVD
jgi:hypothetical protein